MVFEITSLHVNAKSLQQFQATLPEAMGVISCAEGYLGHTLDQNADDPCRYQLIVQWETMENAIDRFRESGRMKQLRYLLMRFYDQPAKSEFRSGYDMTALKTRENLPSEILCASQSNAEVTAESNLACQV